MEHTFITLVRHARAVKHDWAKVEEVKGVIKAIYGDLLSAKGPFSNYVNKPIALIRLIKRPDNPFANEVASLKLFQAVLKHLLNDDGQTDRSKLKNQPYILR